MMVAWLKALLFVVGGVTAAAGTAYVTGLLDPWIGRGPTVIASLPDGGAADSGTEDTAPEGEAAPGGPVTDDPATPDDPATTDKQGRLVAPSFDLVRVEPDGSLLVAGKAAAGATVNVLTGDTVLGSATVGEAGDFVVVLDNPLEPGDYQIALRATSDGTAAMSTQTALVSIPETPDGEVLALVEEPGAPSRLITVPEGTDTGETAGEGDAAAAPAEDAPDDGATGEEQIAAAEEAAAEDRPAGTENDAAAQPEAGGNSAGQSGDAVAETDGPVSAGDNDDASPAPEEEQEIAAAASDDAAAATQEGGAAAPQPQAGQEIAADGNEPEQDRATPADASVDTPTAGSDTPEIASAGEPQAGHQPSEQELAALPSDEPAGAAGEQPAQTPRVVVEAVEIEGDTVFVAGYADPGSTVRVYANEVHLGDARASEGGRFLVEARRELAVGDYVIRADVLAPDGSVVARAAVPFEREPGEAIAAVAVPQPDMDTAADAPQSGSEPGGTAAADPSVPGADAAGEMPAAPDAPEDAQAGAETAREEVQTPGAQQDTAGAVAGQEQPQGTAAPGTSQDVTTPGEDQPTDMAAAGPQDEPSDMAGAAATAPQDEADAAEVAGAPSSQAGDVTDSEVTATPPAETQEGAEIAAAPDEPDLAGEGEFTAPKLQSVDSAVIIRRGDTLWRISRRVYGRGIRYSTIYLANQDQIEDPDRIWPGQVFSVPEETEQGETANMEAIGEQAVPADTESRIIR